MTRRDDTLENGFTAPELLITLFIAAIFLIAGYQLYVQVKQDSGETNKIALISGKLYDELKKAAVPDLSDSCPSEPSDITGASVPIDNHPDFTMDTTYTCIDYSGGSYLMKVEVTGTYAEETFHRTISHATYVK